MKKAYYTMLTFCIISVLTATYLLVFADQLVGGILNLIYGFVLLYAGGMNSQTVHIVNNGGIDSLNGEPMKRTYYTTIACSVIALLAALYQMILLDQFPGGIASLIYAAVFTYVSGMNKQAVHTYIESIE